MISVPKLFFFDTEIAKSLYAKYPPKKPEFDSHKNIIKDWWIICWAGKWNDSKKIIGSSVLKNKSRFKKNPMDDYHPVKALYDQIKDADVIIGHNMANFDWKKFMARVTFHKLPAISKPKIIDTWQMAKAIGEYSSNSLEYLTKYHGLPTKAGNRGNDMWNDVIKYILSGDLKNAEKVIKEVVVYCGPDVTACEALYYFFLPYAPQRFNINSNLFRGDGIECCPKCSSTEFTARGFAYTITSKFQRFQCSECHGWFQSGKSVKRIKMR